MSRTANLIPKYRKHKASGQAVVTLRNAVGVKKDVYLGKHGTAASKKKYVRVVSEWEAAGRNIVNAPGPFPSVNEVIVAYFRYCQGYYRGPENKPAPEVNNIRGALRHVKQLYGDVDASRFDVLALKAVRQRMIGVGLARNTINKDISRIKHCFRWAAQEKMIPASVFHELQALEGLSYGRSGAKETAPILPVPITHVEAVLPFVPTIIADMVRLQLATGMRAGEVCSMRAIDIDTTGRVWLYRPQRHKTQHRGFQRVVALGPRAQEVVRRYLRPQVDAFLFSPYEAREERFKLMRENRKTRVQPSQLNRRKRKPKKLPGQCYTPSTYAQAIQNGWRKSEEEAHKRRPEIPADQHLIPRWTSHQLRHTAAQLIQREFGLDAERAVLGHRSPCLTALYANVDEIKASDVMLRIG